MSTVPVSLSEVDKAITENQVARIEAETKVVEADADAAVAQAEAAKALADARADHAEEIVESEIEEKTEEVDGEWLQQELSKLDAKFQSLETTLQNHNLSMSEMKTELTNLSAQVNLLVLKLIPQVTPDQNSLTPPTLEETNLPVVNPDKKEEVGQKDQKTESQKQKTRRKI